VIILEKVLTFDVAVARALFEDLYHVVPLHVASEHMGFSLVRRPRLYCLLLRRSALRLVADPVTCYAAVVAGFSGAPRLLPTSCMLAGSEDVDPEEAPSPAVTAARSVRAGRGDQGLAG
jgi:hypothetical protein